MDCQSLAAELAGPLNGCQNTSGRGITECLRGPHSTGRSSSALIAARARGSLRVQPISQTTLGKFIGHLRSVQEHWTTDTTQGQSQKAFDSLLHGHGTENTA
jgi:hypothetical protein